MNVARNNGADGIINMPNAQSLRNRSASDGRSFDSFLAASRSNTETPVSSREVVQNRIGRQPSAQENGAGNQGAQTTVNADAETTEHGMQLSSEDETVVLSVVDEAVSEIEMEDCSQMFLEALPLAEILETEEEILASLAAILGVSPQALAEVLAAMGINLHQLGDKEMQMELLQTVHGLETEVDLLNLEGVLPMMQEVSAAIEAYAPVLQEAPVYAQKQELVYEDIQATYTEAAEIILPATAEVFDEEVLGNWGTDTAETEIIAQAPSRTESQIPATTAHAEQTAIEPMMAFTQTVDLPIPESIQPEFFVETPKAPVSQQNVMEQIVNHMRFEVRGDMAEIRIQLKPEHLGEVSMRIAAQNGIVTAQFVAESQRVKEIIEAGFNQLRDALAEQGINIAEIEVSVSSEDSGQNFEYDGQISSARIRQLLAEGEETPEEAVLEDSTVDYRV